MCARSLAMMVVSTLSLFMIIAQPAQGQVTPRQLPPDPPPELPSVNNYSLPPGENKLPENSEVEGPTSENSLPPKALPRRNADKPNMPPADRPVPLAPLPRDGNAQTNDDQDQSAPANNARPNTRINPAGQPTSSPAPIVPAPDDPIQGADQPQPGFTTDIPSQALPSDRSVPNSGPEAIPSVIAPESGLNKNILFYASAGMIFLLLGGLGIYYWRRKAATSYEEARPNEAEAIPLVASVPTPRKPAPKIYSPPDPSEPEKPTPVSSNGFVTSKVSVILERSPTTTIGPQSASKSENISKSHVAGHLQIEFIANGVSSTLLNAVLNYVVTLTNISGQDLHDIRLSGDMTQADAESAKNNTTRVDNLLHKTESLPSGETVTLTGDIRLPLNAIRPITFKSQALFIPLTRFGVDYADDKGSAHQQTSSFIIGREYEPPRPKMAPFRLDLGPRSFSPIGQRPLVTH